MVKSKLIFILIKGGIHRDYVHDHHHHTCIHTSLGSSYPDIRDDDVKGGSQGDGDESQGDGIEDEDVGITHELNGPVFQVFEVEHHHVGATMDGGTNIAFHVGLSIWRA